MLTDEIRNNAITILEDEIKKINHSKRTKLSIEELIELKELLNSEMPEKIVVRKPKYYKCPWKIGDVFAVKLDSDIYEDYGIQGKYAMFVKADEHVCYPKHICPKILCYNWYGDEPLYDIESIKTLDFLPTFFFNNYFNYKILVTIEDEQELNAVNLLYIGNIGTLELPPKIEEDLKNESKKNFSSVKSLKGSMIPINLYIKRNFKIIPNDHHMVEISINKI